MNQEETTEKKEAIQSISFLQGRNDIGGKNPLDTIKQKVSEFSNIKNINFLLGAGTSSDAIPNMKTMHDAIRRDIECDETLSESSKILFKEIEKINLEDLLCILYSRKYYLKALKKPKEKEETEETEIESVERLIKFIENQMFSKINVTFKKRKSKDVLELYMRLYQKITLRNKDLSRANIFTTNNDLFNEKALDTLNFNFNNGFGGGIDRVFNPARFKFTFSKKVDANLEKFEPLDNMVYLYKLHGSISWVEKKENILFNIQEIPVISGTGNSDEHHVLIYPTPMKQNQSLGSPYSDLIREFQTKLSSPNSVLFIIGYSFSDEHLNNIIYQSMASNSSISIVIFGNYENCPLVKISDSRIYQIFGETDDGEKIHYFNYIVDSLFPNLDVNKETMLLDNFINRLKTETEKGS